MNDRDKYQQALNRLFVIGFICGVMAGLLVGFAVGTDSANGSTPTDQRGQTRIKGIDGLNGKCGVYAVSLRATDVTAYHAVQVDGSGALYCNRPFSEVKSTTKLNGMPFTESQLLTGFDKNRPDDHVNESTALVVPATPYVQQATIRMTLLKDRFAEPEPPYDSVCELRTRVNVDDTFRCELQTTIPAAP